MKLDCYHDITGFTALQADWNALLQHNASNEIFLTWEWLSTWWDAYRPGELWLIAARSEAGALVGIAPLFVEAGTRTLRTVGCVDVTDYLDMLVVPDQRDAFFDALAGHLADQAGSFEQISLCNIQGDSATLPALTRSLAAQGFTVETVQQEICPQILLPADFETYLNSLDKKQRHELRRKMRRAEANEDGDDERVAWYLVGAEHDLSAEIEKFIDLMRASHPDKAAFMDMPANSAFFRAVMPKLAAQGWLQLAFLTVDNVPAAAYLNFDYENRIGVYNSGLLPGSYGHLSCGIVLLCYLIRHNIEQGRTIFDFLRGNEEYKYRMGATDSPVIEFKAVLA